MDYVIGCDVLGATVEIPTILVLSGETRAEELAGSPFQRTYVFQNIRAVADHLIQLHAES